jgi:hypothetical protein
VGLRIAPKEVTKTTESYPKIAALKAHAPKSPKEYIHKMRNSMDG